jgi:hypothetical protein
MNDPNVIDLSRVVGSVLAAARFDLPVFKRPDVPAWTSRNLLECRGLTPKGAVVRLGTILIRYDGALMPLWSNYGARFINGWPEKVLLTQIAQRLNLRQPGRA